MIKNTNVCLSKRGYIVLRYMQHKANIIQMLTNPTICDSCFPHTIIKQQSIYLLIHPYIYIYIYICTSLELKCHVHIFLLFMYIYIYVCVCISS